MRHNGQVIPTLGGLRGILAMSKYLYWVAIAIAAIFSLLAIGQTIAEFGADTLAVSMERGGVGLAVLGLCFLHAFFGWKGQNLSMHLLCFAIACPITVVSYSAWLNGMAKSFAPAPTSEANLYFMIGITWMTAVVLIPWLILRYLTRGRARIAKQPSA